MVAPYLNPIPMGGLRERWRGFLDNPDNRAALLSFGTQMLQPMGVGQTFLGQLGQGAAAAGKTIDTRQTQRTEQNQSATERALAIARLGQQGQQIENQAGQFQRSIDLDTRKADQEDRSLDISQQTADAATTRAGRVSTPGQITPAFVARAKANAQNAYDDYVWSVEGTDEEVLSKEDFVQNYLDQMGLTQPQIDGTAFNTPDAAGLATTPDPSAATTPDERISRSAVSSTQSPVGSPMSANQFLLRHQQLWSKVREMLASPDPKTKATGQVYLQRIQTNLLDPQNLR